MAPRSNTRPLHPRGGRGCHPPEKKGSGKDNTGWCFDHLKTIARLQADDSYGFVTPLANAIMQGRFNLNDDILALLTTRRGVPLAKEMNDSTKIRPIAITGIFSNIAASLLNHRHATELS